MVKLLLIALSFWACSISFGQAPSDGNATVPMKSYVDMQSALNKELMLKIIEIQNDNINDNVIRANVAMDKRLDGMNEFRETLKDQSGTFITRGELFAWVMALLGLFFGFSRYMKDKQESANSKGKSIMSGDTVEVKK